MIFTTLIEINILGLDSFYFKIIKLFNYNKINFTYCYYNNYNYNYIY